MTTFPRVCHYKSVNGLDNQSGFSIANIALLPVKESVV